jgi:hypothetical protein
MQRKVPAERPGLFLCGQGHNHSIKPKDMVICAQIHENGRWSYDRKKESK